MHGTVVLCTALQRGCAHTLSTTATLAMPFPVNKVWTKCADKPCVCLCAQVLRRTPHSQRDRSAVDTLRALARGRIWFWQTLPFFYKAFPDLPSWKWPIFGYAPLLQGMAVRVLTAVARHGGPCARCRHQLVQAAMLSFLLQMNIAAVTGTPAH